METQETPAFSVLRNCQLRSLPEAMADCYCLAKPSDGLLEALDRISRTLPIAMQDQLTREMWARRKPALRIG